MNKSIILIANNNETLPAFSQAIKKYTGIFSTKIAFAQVKNTNELASLVEMGRKAELIFINKQMEKVEITALLSTFIKYQSELPVLIVVGRQTDLEGKIFPNEKIVYDAAFNRDYIFNCLRLYLADGEREIDIRIFKEILISVVDVIYQNTQEKLTPYSISKAKSEHEILDIAAVVAFFGEGIKGTLLISTGIKLLRHLSKKLLFCNDSDLTNEMMIDVMSEISNQVLGVIRKALSEYGYELNASMQVTSFGDQHSMHNSSTGHYYSLPFTLFNQAFNVTFCYDTYSIKLNHKAISQNNEKRKLDVRMINEILENVPKTIAVNTKLKVELKNISWLKSESYETDSLHIMHGRGDGSGYILAIDASSAGAKEIVKKMMFCEDDDVNQNLVADTLGELVNQMQGIQKKAAEKFGYSFQNIVHISFTTKDKISYILRNPGNYIRLTYLIEDQHELVVCYGLDSSVAHDFYDISEYLKHQP